jgi:hypothetical protein
MLVVMMLAGVRFNPSRKQFEGFIRLRRLAWPGSPLKG